MHRSSFEKMGKFRAEYLTGRENEKLLIIDLGSQDVNGTYKSIFNAPSWKYVGMDMIPGENVDIVIEDPYFLNDIENGTVDVLISGQALEHIEYFWLTFKEIARVLKSGGLCCIIAPSGGPEHRYPVDCWRFYPDGFRALARFANLELISVTTQWENLGYTDGSDDWKDTLMVCRKPPA